MSCANFEDLASLSDEQIQLLLTEIDNIDLSLAMYRAPMKVEKAIFKNLSPRAGEAIRNQTREMGKINDAAVSSARGLLIHVAQRKCA